MSTTAIEGVVAAGRAPIWVIPQASIPTMPANGGSVPLSALTGATTTKIDCYLDAGDVSFSRSEQTKTRQRLCQVIAETVKVGETIDITISAVYDQQAASEATVNKAYAALTEGSDVVIAVAWGWDSSQTPTTATKVDLLRGKVRTQDRNFPTSADEDLKFTAVVSVDAQAKDVTLTGP